MTRINVIPVEELSDQHLIAEYHELPRCFRQHIDIAFAPDKYCLGEGHMKWAKKHWVYCYWRFGKLIEEMNYRGFKTSYTELPLNEIDTHSYGYYVPSPEDYKLNIKRIAEKYRLKPNWYRWTNREKPRWLV